MFLLNRTYIYYHTDLKWRYVYIVNKTYDCIVHERYMLVHICTFKPIYIPKFWINYRPNYYWIIKVKTLKWPLDNKNNSCNMNAIFKMILLYQLMCINYRVKFCFPEVQPIARYSSIFSICLTLYRIIIVKLRL